MGSANGNRPLLANEVRLLEAGSDLQLNSVQGDETPIKKLVERLQFQNPHGAVAFLRANPGILGQERLFTHLAEKLQ